MNRNFPHKKIPAWRKTLAMLLASLMATPHGALLAQTVPAGTTNTTVIPNGSGNGVPVVNIAAPNAAGLSHNKFNSYNVPVQGQILNNSAAAVQTQLGGFILGNPNVAGARASIILNEVVQPNRSLLQGYQEVAGQAAQVIVANPYGITCTGCGFINTPRATLTTGTPNIDVNGNLTGFAVRQGDILINGAGLDASGQNYFELVARSVVLQGQVNAKDLLVASGSNDFNYLARTVAPAAASGAAPAYAIDSSVLGGMYVDRIRLIATEAGVGVRLLGNVGASVDDITLSAAGKIELQNQMSAQRHIDVAYTGGAMAGAVDIGGNAQVYAGQNLSITGGAGGIALGNALVGAGANLAMTGASLADSGSAANYRFADGTLSVNVSGHAALGGASYDAAGAFSVAGATVDLGTSGLLGRNAASGLSITATVGALNVNGAQLSSPGSVVLTSAGPMTLGAAAFVGSSANITATFGNSMDNAGAMVADGNLQLLNSTASATIVNDGYLSSTGALTLGAANLGSFENGASGTTLAGTLVLNAPSVLNSGYLQAKNSTFATGTNLQNSAGGTLVLGTAAADSNTLTLNRFENSGTLYSAGNLTLSTIQFDNLASGKLIADGTLTASANRAIGSTGLSNTLTNAGSIDTNNASLTAPTINLTGGTTYAANNIGLSATGTLTMGGSLYAGNDLTVSAGTLSDTVSGTRAAGHDFSVTSTGGIVLNGGQVYDAGNLLSITTPSLQVGTAGTSTALTSGSDIAVTTNSLLLGSATTAGSLQAARDISINPQGGNLLIRVGVAGAGPASSLQAGRDIAAVFDQFQVRDNVLANGDITLLTRAGGANRELVVTNGGWIEAAGTLALRGETPGTRALSLFLNPGATAAGGGFGILTSSLYVDDGALLQGGQGGGTIDTTTLTMAGANSRVIANRWLGIPAPDSYVYIGSAFSNPGLLYAQGNMQVTATGNIVNAATGSISTGFGGLTLQTNLGDYSVPYQITNNGLIYGAGGLNVLVPEAGTIYNTPTGNISTGLGSNALLGQNSTSGDFGGTFRNEGVIEFGGNAEIRAASFFNNRPMGSLTRSNDGNLVRTYTASGDSGRYDDYLGSPGYDHMHPPIVAAGAGDHAGRPNQGSFGVSYYHVIDDAGHLYRDFRSAWTESDSLSSVGAQPQILANGTLVIKTFTGQNIGGSISGGNLQIRNIYPGNSGSSFLNQSVDLYSYDMQLFGRTRYDCNSGAACVDAIGATGSNPFDVYQAWTNGSPHANWGVNDGVAQQTNQTLLASYPAVLAAPSGQFFSDIGSLSNVTSTIAPTPTAPSVTPATGQAANPANPTPIGVQQTPPGAIAIGGANVTLPTGPNGLFVPSTNPNSKYLIESNPLYASADNPYLGSDYLAAKLGLDPAGTILRLGDANYEARLIRAQVLAQTGSSILRTAYDDYDQQQMLMDNASLEAKDMRLNWGSALTASQVASLKHDIVWMVEQVVQGKKVLVPVVYLSSATRAGVSGASIVADTAVITGDSFLNRGGKVSGASNLVIVTRKDIVNSSGELSGGNVQLQSLEGDIVNRTETFRSGDASNFTTSAGRAGGIYASNSLFMKADRDVNVQGAAVSSGGDATVLAGRNVNVSALVLDARSTNIQNNSGMFNRDVSQKVETTQTALGASVTAGGNLTVGAKNDVNLTGAYVGSTGTTTLISEQGNVNIGAIALTNTKQESTEHVGFFADSRAGAKPQPQNAAVQSGTASAPAVGGSATRNVTADAAKNGTQKPPPDPNATSAEAFTGLAITTSQSMSSATGNVGSMVEGAGVNIVASKGDVNIQGSTVNSGSQGTLIDAAGNVNITAAYDTTSSTRREQSTRIGVAAEASPGGAYAGVKVDGSSLDSQSSSSTASVSSLNSTGGGSVSIRAGGRLTNEGTSINSSGNVNVIAAEVVNKAAANTTSVNERSTNFNVSVMGGLTTGGIGDSVAGLAQGTGKELNIGSPEAQLRAQASGSSTDTTSNTSTAVVTQIKSGGSTNFQVSGRMLDQGTTYSSGGNINLDVGSYESRAAANTSSTTVNSTSGGGTLTVGVDASRSANANLAIQGRNEQTATSSSDAVVGGLQAGGSVNIRSRSDVTLEGTRVGAGSSVNIDAAGALNVLQANNTSSTNSKTSDGSANLSASLCVDLSCASAGAGASARTTTLNETTSQGVAGSISGANVNLRSGGNMTLQGTNIQSSGTTSLDAGGKVDFQALTSTISSQSTVDGGGANLNANVGASGRLATDGGGGGDFSFERGRGTTEGTVRQGGSIAAGALSIRSGGDTRLEGTQVQAGSAALNVGGNLTLESAQSTLKQDNNSVSGGVQVSAGKSADGGRNFGGAISLDVTNQTKDNLTNQNARIATTGTTTLNVAGDATLAGANIDAGGGVGGRIQGNLTVETRADREKTEDTSFRGYVGVGNIQTSGKGDGGKPSTANKIDSAQDKFSNVANTAGGTGVFIDYKSDKTDNVTIGQRSGISGGASGLGGLSIGGNANLIGAENTQGINVQGTTTSSAGPQTRSQTTSDSFTLRGTVASAAGSDQGSGGTFSNVFQASGGAHKPGDTGASDPAPRPRGDISIGGHRDAGNPTAGGLGRPATGLDGAPVRGAGLAGAGNTAGTTIAPRSNESSLPRPPVQGTPARPSSDAPAGLGIVRNAVGSVTPAPAPRPQEAGGSARPLTSAGGPAKPAAADGAWKPATVPTGPAPTLGLGDKAPTGTGVVQGGTVIASASPSPRPQDAAAPAKPAASPTAKPADDAAPKPAATPGAPKTETAAPKPAVALPSGPEPVTKTPSGPPQPSVDPATGKVVHVQNVSEANPNGKIVDGFKLSEPVRTTPDQNVVLSPAERSQKELAVNAAGELVYKADPNVKFDTAGGATQFVVDPQGRIFANDAYRPDPKVTHESLAGGGQVRVAGEIQVHDGKIVKLNNKSDAFASSRDQAFEAVVALRDKSGVDLDGTQVGFFQPQVVDNPDGSKRTVQLALSFDGTKVAAVEDRGPPTAAELNAKKVAESMPRIALGNDGREILKDPATGVRVTTPAAKYSGEEGHGVKYLTGAERARNEIVVKDGKLVSKETGKPFSTGTKEDGAIFVIDSQGRMYASTENKVGEFHHTSLTGGEPVASAGHVVVRDGVLLHMNNFSGHYQPDTEMLKQGIDMLQGQGLRFDNTRVVQLSPSGLQEVDLKSGAIKGMPQGPGTPNATFNDVIRADAERSRAEDNIALMAKLKPLGDGNAGRKLLENPANGLKLTTAASGYKDENKPKLDATGNLESKGVKYLSGEERARAEVVVKDGKLVNKITGEPFSTGTKEDGAIFVIDSQGRMYASTGNKVGEFHHTSLTGGEPVASAGHVVVRDGVLLHMNNFSGHYQPDTGMLKQGIDLLKKQGLDMADTRVVQLSPTGLQEVDLKSGAVKEMPQGPGTPNATFNDVIRADAERARAKDNAELMATLKPLKDGAEGRKILENPANGLKLTTAAEVYRDETKPKFDASGKFERPGVKYFSGEERAHHEVLVKDGKLVYADDHTPVNTGGKEDGAIFVIDAQGRMYASTENQVGVIHHTSLTGGEPVAAAGHMVVRDGQLLHINNMSGHYRPDETMLQQGIDLLKNQGIDLSEANIVRYNSSNGELERTDANGNAIAVIPRAGMNDVFDLTRPDALRAAPPAAAPAPAPVAPPGKTSSNGEWLLAA